MRVNIMELRETGSLDDDTTLIQIDEQFVITIKGFGTGGYQWKVHTCSFDDDIWHVKQAMIDLFGEPGAGGFYDGQKTLGNCLVWAEPRTFAHVIYDIIRNQ